MKSGIFCKHPPGKFNNVNLVFQLDLDSIFTFLQYKQHQSVNLFDKITNNICI
jgi:hypothetical protein